LFEATEIEKTIRLPKIFTPSIKETKNFYSKRTPTTMRMTRLIDLDRVTLKTPPSIRIKPFYKKNWKNFIKRFILKKFILKKNAPPSIRITLKTPPLL